ncbi:MAG: FAD-dependent oxidoreductase [Spirochaetales bacterium]|nr:FAD-dependent oxidoreductase [Spirochaetales bacterium]
MNKDCELLIVGGGISGSIAGIAAARAGVKTLMIEQNGYLGGMLTAGGVGPMMTFHAGDIQVVRGITGELIERLKEKGFSTGHLFDTTGYTYSVTPFDPEGMKSELEQMFLQAGGTILFHTMLADVSVMDKKIQSLRICNKSGLSTLSADVYIDATGDADLSARAGVDCIKGRESDGLNQPLTMNLRLGNVDIDKVRNFIRSHPDEFPKLNGDTSIVDRSERLSMGGFVNIMKEARKRGEISFDREIVLFFETNNRGEVIVNTSRISGLDPTNPSDLSRAEIEGRKQTAELLPFLRKRIPGYENAVALYSGPAIGVRSSRQIKGLYTLNEEDILSARKFDDAIACYGYPIDIHSPGGEKTESRHLKWGDIYTIPYRSLINNKIKNLITVGRCISSTFAAQASFRTTPGAGAIGHGGGAAAAAAVKDGKDFDKLDFKSIKTLLIEQNAYLKG